MTSPDIHCAGKVPFLSSLSPPSLFTSFFPSLFLFLSSSLSLPLKIPLAELGGGVWSQWPQRGGRGGGKAVAPAPSV